MTIAGNNPKFRLMALRFGLRQWLWGWLIRRWITAKMRRDRLVAHFARVELRGALSSLGAYRRSRRSIAIDPDEFEEQG
jgi:hypothetical protein